MSERGAVEALRNEVLGIKDAVSAAKALIINLVQRLSDALDSDNTEADIRVLRDELEAAKADLANAVIQNTPADRGPNAPDDSFPQPVNHDPLQGQKDPREVEGGEDDTNAPSGEELEEGVEVYDEDGNVVNEPHAGGEGGSSDDAGGADPQTGDSTDAGDDNENNLLR